MPAANLWEQAGSDEKSASMARRDHLGDVGHEGGGAPSSVVCVCVALIVSIKYVALTARAAAADGPRTAMLT